MLREVSLIKTYQNKTKINQTTNTTEQKIIPSVSPSNQAMLGYLDSSRGAEKRLPTELTQKLENHYGYNLSALRIRESSEADKAGGKAFTQGTNINFGKGMFQPQTKFGQKMIAHEVAHVIQQAKENIKPTQSHSNINLDSSLESEADNYADSFFQTGSQADSFQQTQNLQSLPTTCIDSAPVQGWGFASLAGTKDRGHDLIMPSGRRMANNELQHGGLTAYSMNDQYNLDIGNFLNDMGPDYRDARGGRRRVGRGPGGENKISSTNPGIMNSISFGLKFKLGSNKNRYVQQTHMGDLQFLHGMKSGSDRDVIETSERIKLYAKFAYGMGTAGVRKNAGNAQMLTLDSKVGDLATSQFASLGLHNVYTYFDGEMRETLKEIGDAKAKLEKSDTETDKAKYRSIIDDRQKKADFMLGVTPNADDRYKPEAIKDLEGKILSLSQKPARTPKENAELNKLAVKRQALMESYKGRSLREMVGVKDDDETLGGATPADKKNNRDQAAKMRFLGSLSHMAQDTFANSHAFRGFVPSDGQQAVDITDADSVLANVAPILQNADYTVQDEEKHHAADLLAKGTKADDDMSRVDDTAGAKQARDVTAHILHSAATGKSVDEMSVFFDRLFKVDEGVEKGARLRRAQSGLGEVVDGVMPEDLIHMKFQVPGAGRAYRKKELHELAQDRTLKGMLSQYSSMLESVELGHGEGAVPEPTRQKTAAQRGNELIAQAETLIQTLAFPSEENLRKEIGNDLYDIYMQLQSIQRSVPNPRVAYFITVIREMLQNEAG